jgi:hypothetical protein
MAQVRSGFVNKGIRPYKNKRTQTQGQNVRASDKSDGNDARTLGGKKVCTRHWQQERRVQGQGRTEEEIEKGVV